jgi:alpha-1,2-mannosyltransferase
VAQRQEGDAGPVEPRSKHGGIDWAFIGATTFAGFGLVLLLLALPLLDGTPNWAEDFVAYRSAALRLVDGGTIYTPSSLAGAFEPLSQNLYLYPPPLGIAMTSLSGMPAEQGATTWYLLHVAVLALACALMPVQARTRILTFALAAVSYGVLRDLVMGNVSVLLLLPLVLGWRWLDRPAGSIALAVAAAVRVSFAIYLLWFLIRRAWRPLLWMAIGGASLFLLSLPFVGIDGYRDYLTMLSHISAPADLVQNRHLSYAAQRMGMPTELAWLMLIPVFLLALGAVFVSRRRDPEVGYMVAAAAALLLAPLIWDHYLSLLLLPAAFLAERGRPWAMVLPLLTWLPGELLPFVSIAALLLPFLAKDAATPGDDQSAASHASIRRPLRSYPVTPEAR